MRTFHDGKILADCFSEKRLLGFPPGVGVLLIMFNRFHNYVVEQLAIINEGGRFTKPKDGSAEDTAKYDNDLFQTGRLITCGLYVNCILKDYVRTILNLNRTDSQWDLDPRIVEKKTTLVDAAAEGVATRFPQNSTLSTAGMLPYLNVMTSGHRKSTRDSFRERIQLMSAFRSY